MKKFLIVLLVLLSSIAGQSAVFAEVELAVDPIQIMTKNMPASSARGMIFVENVGVGPSIGWIRYAQIPPFNSDGSIDLDKYWNWNICATWTDSACPQKEGFTTEGKVILGVCKNSTEIGCIEDFKIKNPTNETKRISYLGPAFKEVIETPEDRTSGIPRSSSPALYGDEIGNLFIVRAGLFISKTGPGNIEYKFDVDVNPVVAITQRGLLAPIVTRGVEPRTGFGNVFVANSPSECIATDVGICYKALKENPETTYSIDVRVPRKVSGWLRGRVSKPVFSAKILNGTSQIISVSAQPAVVPIVGGWVDYVKLPKNFIEDIWPSGGYDSSPSASYFLVGSPSQGEQGTREYEAWLPYFSDKSLVTLTNWSFGTNMSGSSSSCLTQSGKVTGFVASNAAVYSSNPPSWNAATGVLSYKVGAPHFDENGIENSGTYTLAMPVATIQCLYGQSSLPPSATVSISYGSEAVNVATVTLKSDSGWVYFSANGFHYSSPTINVKFNKSQSVTPTPTKAAVVKKTITCKKGKVIKKVVAVSPKCPNGYKKVA